jgi:hypothetical protein
LARQAILHMTANEQDKPAGRRHMSWVLWDSFTGSAPYRDIFLRALLPGFWSRLLWRLGACGLGLSRAAPLGLGDARPIPAPASELADDLM